jgi:hypothetical protein
MRATHNQVGGGASQSQISTPASQNQVGGGASQSQSNTPTSQNQVRGGASQSQNNTPASQNHQIGTAVQGQVNNAACDQNDHPTFKTIAEVISKNPDCHVTTIEKTIILQEPSDGANPFAWAIKTFHDLATEIRGNAQQNDIIGVTLTNDQAIGYEMNVEPMRVADFTGDTIMAAAEHAAQSSRGFQAAGIMTVTITRVEVQEGRGKFAEANAFMWGKHKSVITPRNDNGYHKSAKNKPRVKRLKYYHTTTPNNYCGVYAAHIGMRHRDMQRSKTEEAKKLYNIAVRQTSQQFANEIDAILDKCGLDLEERGMDYADWLKLQNNFPDYKFMVYTSIEDECLMFEGKPENPMGGVVTILLDKGHYAYCSCPPSLFKFKFECPDCGFRYMKKGAHFCKTNCFNCGFKDCGKQGKPTMCCRKCHMSFTTAKCFENHKMAPEGRNSKCDMYTKCTICGQCYYRLNPERPDHTCSEKYCYNCSSVVPRTHLCYIDVTKPKKSDDMLRKKTIITFYDMESQQSKNLPHAASKFVHIPNMIVAQTVCIECENREQISCSNCGIRETVFSELEDQQRNIVKEFLEWCYLKGRGLTEGARKMCDRTHILVAHNGGQYDNLFIFQEMMASKDWQVKNPIMRGQKLIRVEATRDKITIVLLDFINYVAKPLSALCKSFKLDENLAKGEFPFFMNDGTPENYNFSESRMPDPKFWCPDGMPVARRKKFFEWWEKEDRRLRETGLKWEFYPEMLKYCKNDTTILRLCCQLFRGSMTELGVDPIRHASTIAGVCSLIYSSIFMPKNSIGKK